MLRSQAVTDPAEIDRLYTAALLQEGDHDAHCSTEVPYIALDALKERVADERSLLVCVYDGIFPMVFAVVNSNTKEGEWLLFCARPDACFEGGEKSAVYELIEGVVKRLGYYYGRVQNPRLRELFASIPGVTIVNDLDVETWRA